MTHWTTADLIPYVCRHINDVHTLAALSTVNKALNHYLFSTTGGSHWIHAGKLVCGEGYWPQDDLSLCLEQEDPRYLTKIRICPWISEPVEIDIDERVEIEHDRTPTENDKHILSRLNKTRWAPHSGKHYGMMEQIIKLHDSVSIVTSGSSSCYDQVFAYFIASKDLRLLRDRYYITSITKPEYDEVWHAANGNLYIIMQESEDSISTVMRFGIRKDKSITPSPPPMHRARTIQAFWSAFRGDLDEAFRQISSSLGSIIDLSSLRCHDKTLAEHIVIGGSLDALKRLLQTEPLCAEDLSTITRAMKSGRGDMVALIASMIHPPNIISAGTLWFLLTGNREEFIRIAPRCNIDNNLACIRAWKSWIENENESIMPPSLILLCTICAKASTPTTDKKQLVDIMQEYTAQLLANYDDDEDESVTLLRYKVKSTIELLKARE